MTDSYKKIILFVIGVSLSFILMAENKSKQQLKPNTSSINAEYRVAKNKCSLLSGTAEDSCLAQARAAKAKAVASAKSEAKISKSCTTGNNKTGESTVKAIDEDLEEDQMDSAVTEVKPIESDIAPFEKDIFRDRIKIVAMR